MDYVKNAVKLRRELHQIPELGWGEFCTTAKILETIEPLGWKTYTGVEQVGLDAVMGRPEDFVEKANRGHWKKVSTRNSSRECTATRVLSRN